MGIFGIKKKKLKNVICLNEVGANRNSLYPFEPTLICHLDSNFSIGMALVPSSNASSTVASSSTDPIPLSTQENATSQSTTPPTFQQQQQQQQQNEVLSLISKAIRKLAVISLHIQNGRLYSTQGHARKMGLLFNSVPQFVWCSSGYITVTGRGLGVGETSL